MDTNFGQFRSVEHGQARAGRAKRFWCRKSSVRVLGNLFGRFKILLIRVTVVVLTFVGRVVATNLRTCFVNSAAVVVLKMATNRVHKQIPRSIFNENARLFVKQVPSDIFKISKIAGSLDRKREVSTAFGGAMFAQIFACWQVFTF